LRLRTFGGLWLEGPSGSEPPAVAPRRLALLAVLAAAGPRGLSRARLLGVLWPEGREERGRHALAQTVYNLRSDLGNDGAITGSTDLRLDPAIVESDVVDFNAALGRGDRQAAARLYSGPFLDGFYLSDAGGFEHWVEDARARLAAAAVATIEQLAGATGEIAWRRRLTELDPLSGRYATDYMKALAAAGSRADALAHARTHAARIKRELETLPDPEVTRLADRLRVESAGGVAGTLPVAPEFPGPAVQDPVVIGTTAASNPPERRRGGRFAGILVLAILIAVFVVSRLNHSRSGTGFPLLAVGSVRDVSPHDSANSGVLTDMLATSLARIPGLQVVANSRLLELIPRGTDTARGALPEAARRVGAQEMLEGELTAAPDGGFRLDLRRIDLVSGVVREGYSVRASDRYAAVDSATAAIAENFGLSPPSKPIAEVSTSSLVAYRLYEEGLRAFYQYDIATASRLMDAALREDSTFAMAAYYAWRSGPAVDSPNEPALRERALRLAPRAADRERLLILGRVRVANEDPAAVAPAESLAIRFPADPDGQELLGLVEQLRGDYPLAAAGYLRAVALDSAASVRPDAVCHACEGLHNLFNLYAWWDSMPAAERAVQSWIRFRPDAAGPLGLLAEIRWREERWSDADAVLQRFDSLSHHQNDLTTTRLRVAIRRGQYDDVSKSAALMLADPDRARRSEAYWLWLIALRNQGRLREAWDLATNGQVPGGGTISLDALESDGVNPPLVAFERGDYTAAIRGFRALAASAVTNPQAGHRARGVSWNLTHAGVAYAAAGDTAAVHRLADSIELIGPRSLFGRGARLHLFLRGLLLAAGGRHAEAVESYRRAQISWTEGYTRINYELAKSLLALHRAKEAVLPLQAALRGGIDGSNLYVTRTDLHEALAQSFAAAGQPDSAAVHYAAVVRALERADPPLQPRREAAAAWLRSHGR
jgi:DNA-binding SARP family transcriptional activator/tetratricopeptide (TPR) repeat protein